MRRDLVYVVALLGTAATTPELHAQPSAASEVIRRLSGCYRLTLGRWSGPLPATGVLAAQTPPSRFRLDTAVLPGASAASHAVEPRELSPRRRGVMPASWRPLEGDSLSVIWSTGLVGVALRLAQRGDTLAGQARAFHDAHAAGEPPDPVASVTAVRVRCDAELRTQTRRAERDRFLQELFRGEFPDDYFADIAGRVPGFAGLLVSADTLMLMLVDPSRRAEAEAAVQQLVGGRYRHVAVRRAEYDFRQLRDWKNIARRASGPGWTMLDADERRNRIVLGVRDSIYLLPARQALEAQGIPPSAIIVQVAGPVIPVGGRERERLRGPATPLRFEPVQLGLLSLGGAFVNAWADFDADGDLDLFVGFNGAPNRLYRNDVGVLTEIAATAGVADARATRAAAWGDFDADGDPDLLVGFAPGAGSVLRLYRNDGGRFADITTDARLVRDSGAVRQPAWVDVDGDGDLDLFVAFRDRANALFQNDGGTFRDVAAELGLADTRRSVGAVWFDYDEDGDLDLYVGNMDGDANGLFRNDGGRFVDVATEAGVAWGGRLPSDPANGTVRPCAADVDGDGHLDIFTANYGKNGLFLNRGGGRFEDVSSMWGIAIDARYDACAFADVDHDGRLDLYVNGTVTGGVSYRDYLFRNLGDRFEDVTTADLRALQADHGVQWADFDGDGDADLALTGARPDGMHLILRNMLPAPDASRSIRILVLDANARATRAGAEVRIFATGTRRVLGTRLVDSGSGYDAQSEMPVHFGLATPDPVVDVEVIWPSAGKRTSTWVRGVRPREWRGRVIVVRAGRRGGGGR